MRTVIVGVKWTIGVQKKGEYIMSQFVGHGECSKCGSSDARSYYDNDTWYCFSCQASGKTNEDEIPKRKKYVDYIKQTRTDVLGYQTASLTNRKIKEDVVVRFGLKASVNEQTGEQDTHYYPYYIAGELSGYKVRKLPKDFSGAVDSIKGVDMFGQHLCVAGGNSIVVTEGEIDALSFYQVLADYGAKKGWAKKPSVVSLAAGAASAVKEFTKHFDFLNSFKTIYVSFDSDDEGQRALAAVSLMFEGDKLKVVKLPKKDANEMLLSGDAAGLLDAFYRAEPWKPDSHKNISETRDLVLDRKLSQSHPYPPTWFALNKMTYGRRLGELDTFTSGTGSGKTQFLRELQYHDLTTCKDKIGIIALEEPLHDTVEALMSIHLNKRIHLPDVRAACTKKELEEAFNFISNGDRIELHDGNGVGGVNDLGLLSKIRYFATNLDCKYIYLDHLSMVVSEEATKGDERKRIDELMTKLKQLTIQLNIWIGLVVHLRKSSGGQSFEQGALPSEDDLRGSGGIKQLSNTVIALQRNKRHSVLEMRDIVQIHVLKNRYVGREGEADVLKFDQNTGRLERIQPPPVSILEKKERSSEF